MNELILPKQLISRNSYISRIKPFINKNLIKVLTGQRRVGKSYLLFQLMQEIEQLDTNATLYCFRKQSLPLPTCAMYRLWS